MTNPNDSTTPTLTTNPAPEPTDTARPGTTLKTVGLVHTPHSWAEVEGWIERHNVAEKAHLYTLALMMQNLIVADQKAGVLAFEHEQRKEAA